MANKSGGSTAELDLSKAAEKQQANAKRLTEINREMQKLDKQKEDLLAEAQQLMSGGTTSVQRRGRRKSSGRSTGSRSTGSRSSKREKGGSKTGETRQQILLRVMPEPNQDPLDKHSLTDLVQKAGYESASDDPTVGVSQDLGRMKDDKLVDNPERGKWRLTKQGVNSRDKQQSNGENSAGE
jgi:hypothetical protein